MSMRRDRGSAPVEAAIVFTPLLMVGLLMFAAVNTLTAQAQVRAAARSGARAAAVADSAGAAAAAAAAATAAALSSGSSCQGSPSTSVSGFAPGGVVTVTVTCTADPVFPIVLGAKTYTTSASEAVSEIRGGL